MAWYEQTGDGSFRVRYRDGDGVRSIPGFPDETAAKNYISDMDTDRRRGTWTDPTSGQTLLGEWAMPTWIDSLDVDQRTEENYRSFLRVHILPRWGATPLDEITNSKARAWEKTLRIKGLARSTVTSIMKCFSLLLSDAVDETLIDANPIRARRRGRRRRTEPRRQQVWAEPADVLAIADQIALLYGIAGAVLVVTAAWTGMRWGELVGLQRHNLILGDTTGKIIVDPDFGALHEPGSGPMYLGPPKTDASVREVTLPPFLVALLRWFLTTHEHPHVFVTPQGELHRRSNFARRAFRPAADGNARVANPKMRLRAIKTALKFHGLRHSHKTWLIDDGIPEIAQALRLGHVLEDKVQETYSHVAAAVECRLLEALQVRWEKAVAGSTTPSDDCTWRAAAA
ncbi:tyrosine-type recombinase/integrase [Amycolatopsis sp. GA6-003]|uniref:tyrosine-type recombinase/integrase n=1 Tax=Amycolatopsis sp. GA6-003 TaxID=2652444 RepID=UPI00391727CA